MSLNLKALREAASLSQSELGSRILLSQAQISRYESEPGSATIDIVIAWCGACGSSLEAASRMITPVNHSGIDVGQPYIELHRKLSLLEQYVDAGPKIPNSLPPISITPEEFRLKVKQWKRKPTVLIAGRFDSGKTRIANALLGSNFLPSQYTPTTSVVTFIRHESERPSWQREEVWIMGKEFDPSTWNDEKACQQNRLIAGSFDTLRKFGTKESEGEAIGAKSALVYMDAPLLHACTLVDVPGYSDDYEEERMANASATSTDVLIYTAPAKGFLDAPDFLHLGLLLRALPAVHARSSKGVEKFSNLFLVATHAEPSISDKDLERILTSGTKRLYRHLKDSVLKTRQISEEELRARFRTFWYENQQRRVALEEGVQYTLSKVMPISIESHVDTELREIKSQAKGRFAAQIAAYEETLSKLAGTREKIATLRQQEPQHRKRVREKKKEVSAAIESLRVESVAFVRVQIAQMVTASSIEEFIRKQFPKKDEAKRDAIAKLLEDAQSRVDDFLKAQAEELKPIMEGFFKEYDVTIEGFKSPEYGDSASIPFDAQGAFVGGLAGLGTLGILGIWASTMGNLGGYILIAKLASVLSAVGLGVGSTSLVTFVAAIGGPVTLAIGLASLITLGLWALLGESWQSRLAKKIEKILADKKFLTKVEEGVNSLWEQTWRAFEAGADEVAKKFGQYLLTNEQLLSDEEEGSREKIEATIKALEELKDFFAGIPWRSPS
jgi:transcriptional regulator with XRE-family HTH domain